MSGIYIHIPFCSKKCGYCDFYSVGSMSNKEQMLESIIKDISLRAAFIASETPTTIYFGGGTPSTYSPKDIARVIKEAKHVFGVTSFKELTIELNPEDITGEYIKELKKTEINRISVGIQSFNDERLKFMRRRHSAQKAITTISELQKAGYDNISIDLIYGIPGMTSEEWQQNIETAVSLNIQHISAYHLTIEPTTYFGRLMSEGRLTAVEENVSSDNYNTLTSILSAAGFIHYEISNFAISENHISKHNSSYWNSTPYLGVGPSAHSYDGNRIRTWVVSSNKQYIESINNNTSDYLESETLSDTDLFDEYVMISMRRAQGIYINELEIRFPGNYKQLLKNAESFLKRNELIQINGYLKINPNNFLISDYIISTLISC